MNDLDVRALTEALTRILRAPGHRTALTPDREGWVAIEQVCAIAARDLAIQLHATQVQRVGQRVERFEVSGARIRILARRRPRVLQPDILFHATTASGVTRAARQGRLMGHQGRVFLSSDEAQAWRAAHRLRGSPRVVTVDALRARRRGVRIRRNRSNGLYVADPIPAEHLLSLHPGFDEQLSAGGIPIRRFEDGKLRMALVEVQRRSGTTWEVAKGKLEEGETPEACGLREVQEEMGFEAPLQILRLAGHVRYGFLAPGGLPRLKTIFLYVMQLHGPVPSFAPSEREGIRRVGWFTPEEAVEAVTHSSLLPVMRRARDVVNRYGTTPSDDFAARGYATGAPPPEDAPPGG